MARGYPTGVYRTKAGTFKAHVRLPDGSTRTPTFLTDGEAAQWRAAALESISHCEPLPPTDMGQVPTAGPYRRFSEVAAEFLDHHYGAGTATEKTERRSRRVMENWVLPEFGDRRVGEITPGDVSRFRQKVFKRQRPSYAKGICWLLDAPLRYAFHLGMVPTDPTALSRVAKGRQYDDSRRMHYFPIWQTWAIATEMPPEERVGLWIQRACGPRPGELHDLRISDIDHEHRILFVPGTKTAAAVRWVGIPDMVYDLIVDHLGRFRADAAPDDSLMLKGGQTGADTYRRRFRRAVDRVGVKVKSDERAVPHALRASMITDLAGMCENPRTVSQIAGHTTGGPDAGSPVTYGVYVLPGRNRTTLTDLAADMNQKLIDEAPSGLVIDDPMRDWMTYEEAATALGVSHTSIRQRSEAGVLQTATLPLPGTRKGRSLVLRRSVDAVLRRAEERIGVTPAALELGISPYLVQKYAAALGFVLSDDLPGHDRLCMTPEQFQTLAADVESERRFRANHLTYGEAAAELGVATGTIAAWVSAGRLTKSQESFREWWATSAQAVRWVTRDSVSQAADDPPESLTRWKRARRDQRPAGHHSVAEAAAKLGVSVATVHNRMRAGRLEHVRVPRGEGWTYWVPEGALEALKRGA